MTKYEIPKGKLCDYCGEENAQVSIINPNGIDSDEIRWDVCITCKKVIRQQQNLSFGAILEHHANKIGENGIGLEYAKNLQKTAKQKIKELAHESGKEVISVKMTRQGE